MLARKKTLQQERLPQTSTGHLHLTLCHNIPPVAHKQQMRTAWCFASSISAWSCSNPHNCSWLNTAGPPNASLLPVTWQLCNALAVPVLDATICLQIRCKSGAWKLKTACSRRYPSHPASSEQAECPKRCQQLTLKLHMHHL